MAHILRLDSDLFPVKVPVKVTVVLLTELGVSC